MKQRPVSPNCQKLTAKRVLSCSNILGECPIWDQKEQTLRWVDMKQRLLHAYHPSTTSYAVNALPQECASFCLTSRPGVLLLSLEDGIYTYDRQEKFDAGRLKQAFSAPAAIEGDRS